MTTDHSKQDLDWQGRTRLLQADYTRFRVSERILLTGHSHQAWPDVALEGQLRAFEDAATHVDDKWSAAFEQADRVRQGYQAMMDDPAGEYALGPNTQALLVRWLSALPLDRKPRLVTTDGEFHSMRRLLDRLSETAIEVVRVAAQPVDTLTERLARELNNRTSAVMVSGVLFRTGQIVPHLNILADAAEKRGIPLLVDAYHATNVLPWSIPGQGLERAFVVGGGYKYCQLGEGNCFLRVPADCDWRPLATGWFAEFATLDQPPTGTVAYGRGRWAFEGSTYDPTSHYRAASVLDFFARKGLTPETLNRLCRHQQTHLLDRLRTHDWPSSMTWPESDLTLVGGFLVIHTPRANDIVQAMRQRGVWVDSRGDALRLGTAPYVTAEQLDQAVTTLHRVIWTLT